MNVAGRETIVISWSRRRSFQGRLRLVSVDLSVFKNSVTVLDNELNRDVLGVHVRHLTFQTRVSHDSRSKHDSQVLGGHLRKWLVAKQSYGDGIYHIPGSQAHAWRREQDET